MDLGDLGEIAEEGDCSEEDEVGDLSTGIAFTPLDQLRSSRTFSATKNVLAKKLNKRLSFVDFKKKILRQEALGESMAHRQSALNGLLMNRPHKSKLLGKNVLKTDSTFSSFAAKQAELATGLKKDKLRALLNKRADASDLHKRGILKVDEHKSESLVSDNKKNNLNKLLMNRPSHNSLRSKQIIRNPIDSTQPDRGKLGRIKSKQFLTDFLTNRPTPEALGERNVLEAESLKKRRTTTLIIDIKLKPSKVDLAEGMKVTLVSCGATHTAVIDQKGVVHVCGCPDDGRLGLEDVEQNVMSLTALSSLKAEGKVSHVSCGDSHTGAVVDGKVFMWGCGSWGRLGLDHNEDILVPTQTVIGEEDEKDDEVITTIACGGYHTLVLTAKEEVYGFGWNSRGQVGVEGSGVVDSPVKLENLSEIKQIAVGQNFSLALTKSGDLYGWGDIVNTHTPKKIPGLEDVKVTEVECGAQHALALADDGTVWTWGALNRDSQLGREAQTKEECLKPAVVPGLSGVKSIAAGRNHSFAITADTIYGWGVGTCLGVGKEKMCKEPTQVQLVGDQDIKMVGTGWLHSAFVTGDGELFTCGSNRNGRACHPH